MPSDKEFQELKALVERIAASPKVRPFLDGGGQWPRSPNFRQVGSEVVGGHGVLGDGPTVSSGEQDTVAFHVFLAKAKPKLVAQIAEVEPAVAVAKAEFEQAQRAAIEVSGETGGRYLNKGRDGTVVEEAAPDALIQMKTGTPEYQILVDAERKLIKAKLKLFSLQKARDAERQAYELKRNPIKNPSTDQGKSFAQRIRLAPFGGKR